MWATVEPLGHHIKGYMQPMTSSLSGAASCDLRTAWKRQDALYAECIPTFNETLQAESFSTGAFDNYNKFLPTKNQTDGKCSINHIGTAYLLKKDRPYEIPVDTIMCSPSGVRFVIRSCILVIILIGNKIGIT